MINFQDDSLSDAQRLEAYRSIINRFLYGVVPDAAAAYRPDGAEINAAARVIGQMLGRLSHVPDAQALGLAYAVHMIEFLPEHPAAAQLVLRRLMLDRDMLPHACDLAKNLVEPLGKRANRAPLLALVERALVETTVIGAHQEKAIDLAILCAQNIMASPTYSNKSIADLGKIVDRVLDTCTDDHVQFFLNALSDHWMGLGLTYADPLADLVARSLEAVPDRQPVVPWATRCFDHAMNSVHDRESACRIAVAMLRHPHGVEAGCAAAQTLFADLEKTDGPLCWALPLAEERLFAERGADRAIEFARTVEVFSRSKYGAARVASIFATKAVACSNGSERAADWLIDMFCAADDYGRNDLHPVFTALAQTSGTGDIRFAALATYINHLAKGDEALYSNRLGHLLTAISDRARDETLFDFGIIGLKSMARRSILAGDFNAAADAVFDVHCLMTPRTGRMTAMTHSLRDGGDGTPRLFARTLGGARDGKSLWPFLAVFPSSPEQRKDTDSKDHTAADSVIALNGAIMSPPDAMRHIEQADDFPPRFQRLARQMLENL